MSHNLVGVDVLAILRKSQNTSQAESADSALRFAQNRQDNGGMSVGAEIRRRRKAIKWTLEDLANRVDSDTGNLSRIETGKQGASEEMLRKISGALGCTVADLFAGADGATNVAPAPLGTRRIPLVSYVQAGHMTEAVDAYAVGDAASARLSGGYSSHQTHATPIGVRAFPLTSVFFNLRLTQ